MVGGASIGLRRERAKITKVRALKEAVQCPSGRRQKAKPHYFAEDTIECVIACTESAIRFCTPTLRISLAT